MDKFGIFFVVGIFGYLASGGIVFKDCGSEIGKFNETKVALSNCDRASSACKLIVLTDATIAVEFELLPNNFTNCVSNVTTSIHGNGISFPLDNSDACLNSGLSCPLKGNQTYKYILTLPIKVYYPPIDVNIKLELVDIISKKNIVCVQIPATISYW